MAPECLRRMQLSEISWQSIPHSWSSDTECSVSELPICPWHDEIATARRSEGSDMRSTTLTYWQLCTGTHLISSSCNKFVLTGQQ